jgi:hypothetical protein
MQITRYTLTGNVVNICNSINVEDGDCAQYSKCGSSLI